MNNQAEDHAKELAQALLKSNDDTFGISFNVTQDGQATGEVIVILAIKTNQQGKEALMRLKDKVVIKAVAGPKGIPCPMCGGSGKL